MKRAESSSTAILAQHDSFGSRECCCAALRVLVCDCLPVSHRESNGMRLIGRSLSPTTLTNTNTCVCLPAFIKSVTSHCLMLLPVPLQPWKQTISFSPPPPLYGESIAKHTLQWDNSCYHTSHRRLRSRWVTVGPNCLPLWALGAPPKQTPSLTHSRSPSISPFRFPPKMGRPKCSLPAHVRVSSRLDSEQST
jgi:hypothetical protein